jgi:hypothetical protein
MYDLRKLMYESGWPAQLSKHDSMAFDRAQT